MKRIIAFLLCLTTLLSVLPLGAFAEEMEQTLPEETVWCFPPL